jgi:DNA-binding response OmpR family regulator
MEATLRLTPTLQKLYDCLSDHHWHSRDELRQAIGHDRFDRLETFNVHLTYLRRALPAPMTVVCQRLNGGLLYKLLKT